ncbi:hypothetical protein A4X13_0g9324, partial [Tilletia indica]
MPVLLINYQARKRAKQTYLETQSEKYRAQGLIRDGPGSNSKNPRRTIHTSTLPRRSADEECDPISAFEFADCMSKVKAGRGDMDQGIALSISGGVESM